MRLFFFHTIDYIDAYPFETSLNKALAYCRLGQALCEKDNKIGIEYTEKGIETAVKSARNNIELCINLSSLGNLYLKLKEFDNAMKFIEKTHEIFASIDDSKENKQFRISRITEISQLYVKLSQPEKAVNFFLENSNDKSLFPEKIDQFLYLKNTYSVISTSTVMLPVYKKIVELGKDFPEEYLKLGFIHYAIAEYLCVSMQMDEGLYYVEEAARISILAKNNKDLMNAYLLIAGVYVRKKDDKRFNYYIGLCDSILKEQYIGSAEFDVYYLKIQYFMVKEDLANAEKYAELWIEKQKQNLHI